MHVNKKLMLWLTVCALALPLMFAGTASAIFTGDGSKPNGTTGGWDITDYGKCVSGVDSAGNLVIDTAHNLSRADCIDHTLTTYTTSATCTATTASPGTTRTTDDVSHYWVSVCVDGAGNGINLGDLDRTAANCILKGGVGMQNACTGSWVYTGPANDGAPGFCYTTINTTSLYPTAAACPTQTVGYAFTSSQCRFSYGIAGYTTAAVSKKDGSSTVAAGTFVDLSSYTQGQCILNGFSWSTGVTKSGTVSIATTPLASTAAIAESSRAGCLECHNTVSQNNTYAERWKEPYLKTGHKNMLRKVTAGNILAGPDGVSYQTTGWANGSMDFTLATATSGTTTWPLMYIFGDWMAAAPGGLDVVVATGAQAARYNGTSTYSCAACHTTGWMNPDTNVGLCSQSSRTNATTCAAAGGTWTPSSGTQGASYNPAQPGASFPSMAQPNGTINGITGKWDLDGIQCSRCHYTVFAKTGTNAAGTAFAGIPGTGTHNVTPASNANHQVNNICYGCHQSIAKAANGTSLDNDTSDATKLPVKNNATAPAYQPEFNSHVIAAEFLGSPHSRYTGTIVPNSLGKYDLGSNTPANYNSTFKGFICRSSTSTAGGSILAEVWKNGVPTKIANLADCQLANSTLVGGVPTPTTNTGVWQPENQGACTTCHDVHQSLFDPAATEPLKRECETCHEDTAGVGYAAAGAPQVDVATTINHPKISGTPFDKGLFANSCEACHMPKATSGGFPMHMWRINSDPAYYTFPTSTEFLGNTKKVANTAVDDHGYAGVWVDLDYACGSCHGGSFGPGATKNGAVYLDRTGLAAFANGMHTKAFGAAPANTAPVAANNLPASSSLSPIIVTNSNNTVSLTDTSTDAESNINKVTVNWGDGILDTGIAGGTFTHNYTRAAKFVIVQTTWDSGGLRSATKAYVKVVPPKYVISGTVRTAAGSPISGAFVTVKFNGRSKASVYTNASGVYTLPSQSAGNYTLTVYKSGSTFANPAASVSLTTADATVDINALP